ncbi:MAG: IS982 family transposase [Candidatus Poribacteria bacterium]|nr:IS982 family transposase [Candidatus Poribacteria bacterium]
MDILTLFCEIDDFFLAYEKWQETHCLPKETPLETRGRPRQLHPSEVMTILIAFHQSGYRTFKHFYQRHVCVSWRAAFPNLVSYTRFVQLKKEVLTVLTFYLSAHLGTCSGISFVDSTRLRVCDNKRISSHRVFAEEAGCSKTSMGWFFGFKLHLVINDKGEILDVELTSGNTDDRSPVPKFAEGLHGSLYGDKGYISKDLRERLCEQGVNLVYKVRKNMDPLDLSVSDEVLLKKRMLIESVIKILKTQTQLEHTRHRNYTNFQVNVISALIAYQLLENKPSLKFSELQEINDLPMLSKP